MNTREKIFRFVRDRMLEGRPPSIREAQHAVGLKAVESARAHLEALVKSGRLKKHSGSRGYGLPSEQRVSLVPLLGRVQAGTPHTAIEDVEGYLPTDGSYPSEELFALTVQGMSMSGAGIFPGDVVLVRQQHTAESGEIVVALVDDEATVKRLRLVDDDGSRGSPRVELHPENPEFDVIVPESVVILGKVVEVRRFLDGRRRLP